MQVSVSFVQKLLTILQEFGFKDGEIRVYLDLLSHSPSTVMNVSRRTKIKRSTCHNIVMRLSENEMIYKDYIGGARVGWKAYDPKKLTVLLIKKKEKLAHLEAALPSIIKRINESINSQKSKE
jgi:sugar-specific transcriptional regulator TrmB